MISWSPMITVLTWVDDSLCAKTHRPEFEVQLLLWCSRASPRALSFSHQRHIKEGSNLRCVEFGLCQPWVEKNYGLGKWWDCREGGGRSEKVRWSLISLPCYSSWPFVRRLLELSEFHQDKVQKVSWLVWGNTNSLDDLISAQTLIDPGMNQVQLLLPTSRRDYSVAGSWQLNAKITTVTGTSDKFTASQNVTSSTLTLRTVFT